MRIIRDYTCSTCGATSEAFTDGNLPIQSDHFPHRPIEGGRERICGMFVAQLSATQTTFAFADKSPRKSSRG